MTKYVPDTLDVFSLKSFQQLYTDKYYYHPHFADEQIDAQRGSATY